MSPSCTAERFPPGKTCAEGKADEVRTRWRSRISLLGEMRRMLALGRGSIALFLAALPVEAGREDIYCFSSSGLGVILALLVHAVVMLLRGIAVLEDWWG